MSRDNGPNNKPVLCQVTILTSLNTIFSRELCHMIKYLPKLPSSIGHVHQVEQNGPYRDGDTGADENFRHGLG